MSDQVKRGGGRKPKALCQQEKPALRKKGREGGVPETGFRRVAVPGLADAGQRVAVRALGRWLV